MLRKTYAIEVREATADGGQIIISTPAVDRDKDRVRPRGARIDNYLKNPVVQWGHNYRDPWATVGKTTNLEITDQGIVADFELRPPANESDPQNIVRLLWQGGWVKTASIGFAPVSESIKENDLGGHDFEEWELLEWSLVPIPANQEALRLAVKAFDGGEHDTIAMKPYPNEHACRLRDPGDFQEGSFRRMTREHEGKEYSVIMGRLQGEDTMTEQAYRYNKDTWEADEARSHCSAHDGAFEAAQRAASAVGVPAGHGWEYKEGDTASIAIDGEMWTATLYEVDENTWLLERGDTPGGNIPENHKAAENDREPAEHDGPPSNPDINADAPEVDNDDTNEQPQDLESLLTAINDFLSEVQEALQ